MNYCTFCRKSDPLKRLSSGEITGPVTRNHKIFKTVGRVEDEPGPSHSERLANLTLCIECSRRKLLQPPFHARKLVGGSLSNYTGFAIAIFVLDGAKVIIGAG
ncbi:unnamed protein product, partial [Brenthis ino]